jgi:hypothetical protein
MGEEKQQEPLLFSLRSVYWREGKQWMSDEFDPMLPGQQIFGQFKASGHRIEVREAVQNIPDAIPIRTCLITTNFQFRYLNTQIEQPTTDEEDGKYLVAEISARITVDYLIEGSETPPKEKLEQWAASNALLHCWPYWREFCHSTLSRMNLPVTMMPMMVIEKKKD